MSNLLEFIGIEILHWFGYFLLWVCILYKRNEDSKIEIFSEDWYFLFLIFLSAALLLTL
jgi:hypothetical protein